MPITPYTEPTLDDGREKAYGGAAPSGGAAAPSASSVNDPAAGGTRQETKTTNQAQGADALDSIKDPISAAISKAQQTAQQAKQNQGRGATFDESLIADNNPNKALEDYWKTHGDDYAKHLSNGTVAQPGGADNPDGGYYPNGSGSAGSAGNAAASSIDTSETLPGVYDQTISDYQKRTQEIIDQLSGVTQKELEEYAAQSGQTIEQAQAQINDILRQLQNSLPSGEVGRVGRVSTTEQERLLSQLTNAQQQQAQNRIDYAVQQGVDQLQRAQEDAASQYQTMRNQVAADEARALDNQALYAEARGDRGGIGAAQYASIQNTAATNQLTVNKEQTKLATDTARQIADLRAQGEFQKADELLSISQNYLSQLMQLKQWADQTNISIDEFNIGVEKWEQEYQAQIQQALAGTKLSALQYTTGLDLDKQNTLLSQTLAAAQNKASMGLSTAGDLASMQMTATEREASRAASAAQQMIAAGITPTDQQLAALGWSKSQFNAYKALQEAAKSAGVGATKNSKAFADLQDLILGGTPVEDVQATLDRWHQTPGYITEAEYKELNEALKGSVGLGYTGD